MSRYVDVKITRETKPLSDEGYGTLLILGTSKASSYTEYKNLAAVKNDFDETTEEYKLAQTYFSQEPAPIKVAVASVVYDEATGSVDTLTAALDEINSKNSDYYYLTSTLHGDAEITALAKYVHGKDKLYFATTDNPALPAALKAEYEAREEVSPNTNLYDNVFIMVHDQPELYPAESLPGVVSAMPFGSYTFTFKTVRGIPYADYTDAEIESIHESNAATYIKEMGINVVSNSRTIAGEYIDVMQSQHFLKSEITKNVFNLMAKSPKIPYTDGGIALVVAEIEKAMSKAFRQGMIAEENGNALYSITYPKRSDIPKNTRANRILPDIKWRAELAGAVESVVIEGTLSV